MDRSTDEVLNQSSSSEYFVDPEEGVFTGPVTEVEREMMARLPRRTLHPSELARMKELGMTYLEWEESKQDQADVKNDSSLGCATISETSSESFSSCYSSDEGSLDNTWDIQERMLAMADRLERGEDIPELGICHSTTEDVQESIPRNCQVPEVVQPNAIEEENKESGLLEVVQSNAVEENKGLLEIVQSNDVEENKEMNPAVNVADALVTEDSISRLLKNAEECVLQDEEVCDMIGVVEEKPLIYALPDDSQLMSSISDYVTRREARLGTPKTNNTSVASYEACSSDDDFDASSVTDVFFQTKTRTPKMPPPPQTTPIKSRNTPIRAAASKTPTRSPAPNKCTPVKNANAKKQALASPKVFRSAAHTVASSPVGMYIRSQPEPMLIENVRKTNTKVIYNNPTSIPRMAVRTSDGRWSMDKRASAKSNTDLKENAAVDDIKPVLPMVLHEAAASQVANKSEPVAAEPWARGKIGKLLQRNPAPAVFKHQGRIKVPQDGKSDFMDVSVLQEVVTGIGSNKSSIPVRRPVRLPK